MNQEDILKLCSLIGRMEGAMLGMQVAMEFSDESDRRTYKRAQAIAMDTIDRMSKLVMGSGIDDSASENNNADKPKKKHYKLGYGFV